MSSPAPAMTLATDRATYAPSDAIMVTLINSGPASLYVPDHQTCCTIISLRLQTAHGWQPVGDCKMMTASRIIEVAAGATVRVELKPGAGMMRATPWPPGVYHVALRYTLTPQGGDAQTLESAEFTVA